MRKRRSYFKVPNALIFDTTLSFATRRVGMIFFAYCNALGGCRKSYEAIAALAGCSVATAVKAVRELSEAGYLTVKHTKYHSGKLGRTVYGKNTYTVDLALLKKGYTILDRAVLEQELTDSALIVLCREQLPCVPQHLCAAKENRRSTLHRLRRSAAAQGP